LFRLSLPSLPNTADKEGDCMTIEQVEEIFDDFGYTLLFQNIRYPLVLSGEVDHLDPDVLTHFFEMYSFDTKVVLTFEEFIYHFLIFKKIYTNNNLPFVHGM
jgi:hypothetical protein